MIWIWICFGLEPFGPIYLVKLWIFPVKTTYLFKLNVFGFQIHAEQPVISGRNEQECNRFQHENIILKK